MPQVLGRLLDACVADAADASTLAAIVSLDPGLAARVVAVASASAGDERGALTSLRQCVAVAGVGAIKAVATAESAARVFHPASDAQEFALNRNWFHTLKCALLARALAAGMHHADAEEAYLAGLLHDIGALALTAIDPAGYPRFLSQGQDDDNLCRLELQRYQVTHTEVGAWLVQDWQLGAFVPDSILYHHAPAPQVAAAHPLIRIVLLANHLAQIDLASGLGSAIDFARLCGAPPASVEPALQAANEELKRIAAELKIEWQVGGGGTDSIPAATSALAPAPAMQAEAQAKGPAVELQARLEKQFLIDSARNLLAGAADLDTALKAIAQAAHILFGLRSTVFFLREGNAEAFSGRALRRRHAKAGQLRFTAGPADSAASLATLGTPTLWFALDGWRRPLDSQLAGLLEAEGVACIPLGAAAQCMGVLVCGIQSQSQADLLHTRMDLMQAFGTLAHGMLEGAAAGAPAGVAAGVASIPTEVGASPEQVRHLLHEVSTPLTIVRNYLGTLKLNLGQSAIGEKELRIVTEEISRVSQILDQFRHTPRLPAVAPGPANLQELLQGILELCAGAGLVPPAVRIETDFQSGTPAVVADPDKLKQVLLNLMKNAFEAMPGAGVLRLSTARWSGGGGGDHVEILIEDSGPGLPEEIQRSIYQPVVSTKGGQHFGIGLSIAGALIREMNGLIYFHSSPSGCRFRIILPVVNQ
ncbi:MAG TPA: HDOD domain-containing protein [Burkholderiales bacterium]|nr:HDOD domain-containing protein [Burkholderiales bacterium]